jgi:3-phenylpropionate/cinnamic acid dioxygenase small subunit
MDEKLKLQYDIEQFYAREANFLDERQFEEWLDTMTDDVRYRVPIAQNVAFSDIDNEYLNNGLDVHWIDEGKETLENRVRQIRTGVHWAEEPLSRTAHLVSNVLIADDYTDPVTHRRHLKVKSHVLTYRQRLADQEDILVGRKHDVLRADGDSWQLADRVIYINQTVYLGSSFSHFI